jgi:ABC-type branched-subunit amino acid transport system substrate-binding protein
MSAAVIVGASACGSDDDSSDTTTAPTSDTDAPTSDTDAPTSDTDAPTSDTDAPQEATGEPIRLGLITRSLYMDFLPAGAEAAIERVNSNGGVNGRPLELVTCSNEDNATAAAGCAQQFADDPTIIATVGDNNSFGGDSNPILEAARVAGVGTSPIGPGDYASPRIFPSNSGGLQFLATVAFLHDTLGAEDIGMATIDTPTAQQLPDLINSQVLASRGTELGATVAIPLAAADVSSQAAALAGSGGQALALTEDLALRYIAASRQQGFEGPFMLSETVVTAEALQDALSPEDLADVYAISYFDKNSEGYQAFLEEMAEYQPDVVPGDLNAIAWLSVNLFADVAAGLDEVTRESMWEAMDAVSGYDTGGMTPPLDFTTPGTALGGNAPRIFDSVQSVYADVYDDGAYVPVDAEQEPISIFS